MPSTEQSMGSILKYRQEYGHELIGLLKKEPDWDSFVNDRAIGTFKKALLESETLIYKSQGHICGYLRALVDGFGIYVSELYVAPRFRGHGFGAKLLKKVKEDNPHHHVYVFSDEDMYYEKLGYRRVGSIFQL